MVKISRFLQKTFFKKIKMFAKIKHFWVKIKILAKINFNQLHFVDYFHHILFTSKCIIFLQHQSVLLVIWSHFELPAHGFLFVVQKDTQVFSVGVFVHIYLILCVATSRCSNIQAQLLINQKIGWKLLQLSCFKLTGMLFTNSQQKARMETSTLLQVRAMFI